MVFDKYIGELIDSLFKYIISFFKEGDCFVLNNICVLFVWLFGIKEDIGVKVELFLLK